MNNLFNHCSAHFILGIDGGGSKTLARLVNINTQQVWQAEGGPSSLTNDFSGAVKVIAQLCQQLFQLAQCQPEQVSAVFGLAGAGSSQKVMNLKTQLALNFSQLTICSDARASAYGANLGNAVAVVALGTGSVGMRLMENGEAFFVGGWGFQVGDQGGGAKLGVAMVKAAIDEFEHTQFSVKARLTQLTDQVAQVIGYNRTDILAWLANANPIDFAKLAPLAFQLSAHCQLAQKLIAQHVSAVESLITLTLADTSLPLVLLGGLAEPTRAYLTIKTQEALVKAKGDALDGACLLAKQQLEQHFNDGKIEKYGNN